MFRGCGFIRHNKFQSTRPVRGATEGKLMLMLIDDLFQSTRPVRGATALSPVPLISPPMFQSTRPVRGATGQIRTATYIGDCFNPRAP